MPGGNEAYLYKASTGKWTRLEAKATRLTTELIKCVRIVHLLATFILRTDLKETSCGVVRNADGLPSKVVVLGGRSDHRSKTPFEVYDLAAKKWHTGKLSGDTWVSSTTLNPYRAKNVAGMSGVYGASAVQMRDSFVVIGGRSVLDKSAFTKVTRALNFHCMYSENKMRVLTGPLLRRRQGNLYVSEQNWIFYGCS